ncbi:MAG: MFS transporter [Marmoricola sp.]
MTTRAGKRSLWSSLRHRDFAWFMAAFTTSSVGSWAYIVALAVWLIDKTGSTSWVAASVTARFVPSLLMTAYSGVIAERFERIRLMMLLDVTMALVQLVMVFELVADVHPALVVGTAAVLATLGTVYIPAAAAMGPQFVPERDLGSANALRNSVQQLSVIVGPAIGAVVMVLWDPSGVFLVNTVTFVVSALCLRRIKVRSQPVDVTDGGESGPFRQMAVGFRTITSNPSTTTLVAFSLIATMVYGFDTVLFAPISADVLGSGAQGYGYLLAGLGAGGIAAAGLVTRLERVPRLGFVILAGMAVLCLPSLVFLVHGQPVTGFVIECIRGAGTTVVDVLALTALQRTVPPDRLGRVFGAFDGMILSAILVGTLSIPYALRWWGLDAVLWATGLGVPVLSLLGLPWLVRMDRVAGERVAMLRPRTALLADCDLFASVPEGALEQLAAQAEFVDITAGESVVVQGERAEAFYVIAEGVFRPSSADDLGVRILDDMGSGAYFGEIGLMDSIPRTATVTAQTDGRLLRLDGQAFLEALTQNRPSAALLDGASFRLSRTQPSVEIAGVGHVGEGRG